ncbi:MAG: hypothetical protein M1812_004734 [Candelaria pacifica]|nr:MAG: hypothetical protein M1812_004734 [Candelaria pacifica]
MRLALPRFCRKLLTRLGFRDKKARAKLMVPAPVLAPSEPLHDGEPRAFPPPATPLNFPHYVPIEADTPFATVSTRRLRELLLSIKSPSDVTTEHIKALNLKVDENVALDDIIPAYFANGQPQFSPNFNNEQLPEEADNPSSSKPSETLSNGAKAPGRAIYRVREHELQFENGDAFRDVRRLPALEDHPPAKPVHLRKFWINLDLMSQYWDTSKDDAEPRDGQDQGYQGRRIGTGDEMPEQYRGDAVRFFIEAIAWQFGCQIRLPTMNPRLAVQTVLFPVRFSSIVYRVPTERVRARAGNLEGPLIGVQCRPTTEFRNPGEALGEGNGEKVDLLREVGAMLLMAQERARDGTVEKKPGEGKWWTTKPRWGGQIGGEIDNATGNSDEAVPTRVGRGSKRVPSRRRQEAERSYRTLSPGPGLWDKKVTYVQVGKNEQSDFDDIFMVSSINHHISILRLRIHPLYLQYLETGIMPPSASLQPLGNSVDAQHAFTHQTNSKEEQPWYILKLQRSKWYDLFSADDRVEALKGVWGVFTWLMRGEEDEDVEMTDASDA